MRGVDHPAPIALADLMPWSVAALRIGRGWPLGPDAASLRARWRYLLAAEPARRAELFRVTRARTPDSPAAQLPGQRTGTGRLSQETGDCPEPVRVLHGAFDEEWLIPDHRLIDAARPELWRVAGPGQVFAVEPGLLPGAAGPPLLATALLPDGRPLAGRPGRVRPLYRRPGGREANLAPGLLDALAAGLGGRQQPEAVLGWALAAARHGERGPLVPLTADRELWERGTALGRRMLWLLARRDGERPKLPGGRRPYVRAPLPARPVELRYDPDEEALLLDEGRIAPVPAEAWDFRVSGERVLDAWFARRAGEPEPGSLDAIRPREWPQAWTSELLELITVLALLAALEGERAELAAALDAAPGGALGAAELRRAGVLPVPAGARRPASVLDHHEEGPEGQFALL
ncbi:type ISP restriction/modification enzyme [Streptomyces sp. NPDC050560]|uniref:type ISP restriction/modification enzyme n=1 Tax=Streptomyces sp. NPDC050560 TaxID=3365630 RepID=UPI0037BD7D89